MSKLKLISILALVTFLAYFSSLSNPFIWDDEQFITSNSYVQNFDIGKIFTTNTVAGAGVQSNYYRPLTTLSFAIDHALWGNNPFGFHLTNLALHIGAGLLLFALLLELFRKCHSERSEESRSFASAQDDKKKDPLRGLYPAFFIALFFLIHPVQTEAVTYINSRGDSLYALFLFGSLWLFTLSLREASATWQSHIRLPRSFSFVRNDILKGIGITMLFVLSLLSKEIALAGVGLYLLIFALFVIARREPTRQSNTNAVIPAKAGIQKDTWIPYQVRDDNIRKGIFIIGTIIFVVIIYLILRFTVLNFSNIVNFYGAENEYTRSLAIRLFTFAKVVWIYLGLLIWPYPLHMERSVALIKSFWSWDVLGILGLVGGVGILGAVELRRKSNPWILFGLLWFLIMLIPASGIIPINGILYEHWLYVPMIGLALSAYGIGQIGVGIIKKKLVYALRPMLFAILTALAILYMFLTIRQNNIWADSIQFYTYTLSFAPDSGRLHNNLGMSLANSGDVKNAISEYQKALSLGYEYPQIYNNLGNAYFGLGDYANAEKYLKKALQLSPNFQVAKINLIKLYVAEKEFDKALEAAKGNEVLIQEIEKIQSQQ